MYENEKPTTEQEITEQEQQEQNQDIKKEFPTISKYIRD